MLKLYYSHHEIAIISESDYFSSSHQKRSVTQKINTQKALDCVISQYKMLTGNLLHCNKCYKCLKEKPEQESKLKLEDDTNSNSENVDTG